MSDGQQPLKEAVKAGLQESSGPKLTEAGKAFARAEESEADKALEAIDSVLAKKKINSP